MSYDLTLKVLIAKYIPVNYLNIYLTYFGGRKTISMGIAGTDVLTVSSINSWFRRLFSNMLKRDNYIENGTCCYNICDVC